MKKIFSAVFMSMVFLGTGCSEDSQTRMKGHTPDSEVPMAVKTAFSSKYPGASDVEWTKETDADKIKYEVEFKYQNKEWENEYDANGNLLESKND